MIPLDLRRYRAERVLRKEFEGMRGKVLTVVRSQLRGKGIGLAAADLEASYAEAWHGLYASLLEGEQIENPTGWLVRVTFRRAIDEHRAARATRVGGGEGRGSYPPRFDAPQDLAGELDDKARLRHLFEGLRTRLSAREREAASLCYLQGLSRAQAAERMGVSEARMRKLMEGSGAGTPRCGRQDGRAPEHDRRGRLVRGAKLVDEGLCLRRPRPRGRTPCAGCGALQRMPGLSRPCGQFARAGVGTAFAFAARPQGRRERYRVRADRAWPVMRAAAAGIPRGGS